MESHKLTKKELKTVLLNKVSKWIDEGNTPEEAIGKLTEKQYDFLIDEGVDFDGCLLTPEQKKTISALKRPPRPKFPQGYNKKYPKEKQDLYNAIAEYIASIGGDVIPREKQNFRDLDFVLQGTAYSMAIVAHKGK